MATEEHFAGVHTELLRSILRPQKNVIPSLSKVFPEFDIVHKTFQGFRL